MVSREVALEEAVLFLGCAQSHVAADTSHPPFGWSTLELSGIVGHFRSHVATRLELAAASRSRWVGDLHAPTLGLVRRIQSFFSCNFLVRENTDRSRLPEEGFFLAELVGRWPSAHLEFQEGSETVSGRTASSRLAWDEAQGHGAEGQEL